MVKKMARFSMLVLILWVMSWAAQANVPVSQSDRKIGDNFKNIQTFLTATKEIVSQVNATAPSSLNKQLNDAKLQLGLRPELNIVQGPVVMDHAPQVYNGERYQGIVPKFETSYYQNGVINDAAWAQAFPRPF